jgi:hypothetical protein
MSVWFEYALRWGFVVLVALWLVCDVIFPLCVGLPAFRLFARKNEVELKEREAVSKLSWEERHRQLAALRRRKAK